MANQVTGNPWIIDTASGTPLIALPGTCQIRAFRWQEGTTLNHQCIVQDGAGREVYKADATGDNFSDERRFPEDHGYTMVGLIVPTLGSGKLYIYFAN